jgi:thiol-disulfide isomerase/thioredoxin
MMRLSRWRQVIFSACTLLLAVNASAQREFDGRGSAGEQHSREQADLAWPLLTLRGARTTLEAFRGRVIVINSWATWCEPCIAEMRSLHALRDSVPDPNVVFALIAPERRESVQRTVSRRALTLPVFLEAAPPPAVYRFSAVPTTWIIDRNGRIVLRHRGAARWDTAPMIALLRELAGASIRD